VTTYIWVFVILNLISSFVNFIRAGKKSVRTCNIFSGLLEMALAMWGLMLLKVI
jgi:hypothetical protein